MPSENILAAVIHELLNEQPFATLADLKETVKERCARLHIPYDSGSINAALDLVERTRPTIPAARRTNPQHVERADDVAPITPAEAIDFLARIDRFFDRRRRQSA